MGRRRLSVRKCAILNIEKRNKDGMGYGDNAIWEISGYNTRI